MNEVSREILFEKFEIIECLKKDAQAAVYLADHIYLGKKIILKSLNTKKIFEDSVIDRFKREAKLLAKLDHPNIIKVLDFGMYGEFFYISFEYFESKNLRDFLKTKSLSLEEKEKLFVQILLGLRFAHSNKIIHRDLKPENVLVDESLKLKISDFGLALNQDDAFETSKYSIVGTPCYMSPEQVNGKKLTMQSDLFSIGSLAYELFTEKNLFLGDDVAQTINNVINFNGASLENDIKNLPDNIKTVVKNLLKKNLNERFKSVDDALEYFDAEPEAANTKSAAVGVIAKKKNLTAILLSSAAVAVLLIILITLNFGNKPELPEEQSEPGNNEILTRQQTANESDEIVPEEIKTRNEQEPEAGVNKTKDEDLLPENPPPAKEEEAAAVINYGKLSVECLPWADVYINDKKIETTPIDSLLTFANGEYEIKLLHPDYPEYSEIITIEPNKTTAVKVLLDSLVGFLKCNVFPWGEVYVDSKLLGQTPLNSLVKLEKGNHDILIKNPGFQDFEGNFDINGQDTVEINFNFSDRKFSVAANN